MAATDTSASPPPRTTPALPQGSVIKTLFVAEAMVECEGGAGPMQCMRVRETPDGEWTLFYSGIEGFKHEAGQEYELRVQVDKVDDPPADGSSLRYRLLEVVNKKTAAK